MTFSPLEGEKLHQSLVRVLRLRSGDAVILFDRICHVRFILQEQQGKMRIRGVMHTKKANAILHPSITFLLPLLKRDDCSAALYSLTEIGVNEVRLVTTQKVQRAWGGQAELTRLQRVMVASEKKIIKNAGFIFCALTPTILRATQATAVGDGVARSIF